ncbi:hypothetical protein ACFZB9_24335 [Kitasatospora sp. NPDC008050]|uniref:hypothetical protein n=1 Tax=Kitasatospora sp. NPDC008050 TaxID=3364021 RepID=UPI0036EBA959
MNKIKAAIIATTIAMGGLAAAAPAQAASTCQIMGAPYECDSIASVRLPNGSIQWFVVGTDHAVWTNWTQVEGGLHGWQSLGGIVQGPISIWGKSADGWSFFIGATGTDGKPWDRQRADDGTWTPWSPWSS